MEASEIIRRNEAIARYMGWKFAKGAWWENDVAFPFSSDMLDFHSNWSRLMPVVESIVVANPDCLDRDLEVIYMAEGKNMFGCTVGMVYGGGKTMIEAVYMAVSDYCLSLEPPKN